jgi:hypothetical protein
MDLPGQLNISRTTGPDAVVLTHARISLGIFARMVAEYRWLIYYEKNTLFLR